MTIVKDIDKGWNNIVQNLAEMNAIDVFVGIHEGETHDGELTAAQVGAVHEFGSKDGRIPQRRWLRAGVEHYSKQIGDKYSQLYKSSMRPSTNMRIGLNRIGLFGVAKVQNYIRNVGQSVWEDISEETKKRKGSTKILIDVGQLIGSVTHTLRPKGLGVSDGEVLLDGVGVSARDSRRSRKSNKRRRDSAVSKKSKRKASRAKKASRRRSSK